MGDSEIPHLSDIRLSFSFHSLGAARRPRESRQSARKKCRAKANTTGGACGVQFLFDDSV